MLSNIFLILPVILACMYFYVIRNLQGGMLKVHNFVSSSDDSRYNEGI